MELTLALIKADAMKRGAEAPIRAIIRENKIMVVSCDLFGPESQSKFEELYESHKGKHYYGILMDSVQPGSAVLVLMGKGVVEQWRQMQGPTDPVKARGQDPECLRARFGGPEMPDNATHGSDSVEAAIREIEIFFPGLTKTIECDTV